MGRNVGGKVQCVDVFRPRHLPCALFGSTLARAQLVRLIEHVKVRVRASTEIQGDCRYEDSRAGVDVAGSGWGLRGLGQRRNEAQRTGRGWHQAGSRPDRRTRHDGFPRIRIPDRIERSGRRARHGLPTIAASHRLEPREDESHWAAKCP
jgi:hypothetical protein